MCRTRKLFKCLPSYPSSCHNDAKDAMCCALMGGRTQFSPSIKRVSVMAVFTLSRTPPQATVLVHLPGPLLPLTSTQHKANDTSQFSSVLGLGSQRVLLRTKHTTLTRWSSALNLPLNKTNLCCLKAKMQLTFSRSRSLFSLLPFLTGFLP